MTVYKDKDRDTYYFIVRVQTSDGKTKQIKRRGFESRKKAKLAEAELILNYDEMEEENPTFEFVATEYKEWYEKRRKQSSYRRVKGIIDYHLIPTFGKKKINDIRNRDITRFQ